MKTNFPIGDFLIKVKNIAMSGGKVLETASNKQTVAIAESLKKLGFISEVKKEKETLKLTLAYKNKQPFISNLKIISKPGLRIYMDVKEIESKKGPSTYIISTPKGVLSSREAIKQRVGGEVIAEIW